MKPHVLHVSDHAVLRYLERIRGIDIEKARREIAARVDKVLQDPRLDETDAPGATGVVIDGYAYRMEDRTVVTILKVNHPDKRTGRVRKERTE
jgi:molybdopterin biosynthesis enzyme